LTGSIARFKNCCQSRNRSKQKCNYSLAVSRSHLNKPACSYGPATTPSAQKFWLPYPLVTGDVDIYTKTLWIIENIHMKQRMMGGTFAIKTREAKDRYIDSQFKNALDELLGDTANYGSEIVLRKLVMSHIALEIAQNLGIDYHAATEELYYYMRKRDEETHAALMKLVQSVVDRSRHR